MPELVHRERSEKVSNMILHVCATRLDGATDVETWVDLLERAIQAAEDEAFYTILKNADPNEGCPVCAGGAPWDPESFKLEGKI